jgi:hypothetical protein
VKTPVRNGGQSSWTRTMIGPGAPEKGENRKQGSAVLFL